MPNEDSGFVFNIPTTTKAYDDLVNASTTKRESLLATSAAKIAALDAIDAQRELDLKEFALGRGRSGGEFAEDQVVGLGKGAISLNEILYGVGEAVLAPGRVIGRGLAAIPLPGGETLGKAVGGQESIHMEDLTGIAPTQFAEDKATLQTMKTEKGRYVDEKVQKSLQERAAGKGERIAEAMKSGRSEDVATILDEIKTIGSTISAYADNPAAAIDAAVEQIPQLLGAGVAGSVARATAVRGMAKHEAASYVSSAAGKEALTDISTKAGVAYTAVSEGASNAVAAKGEILSMSHEDLFDGSPLYARLVGEGVSHEDARMQVSDKVFNATFGLAAAVGGVAAKISGAAKFEGNLFNAGSAVKGIINKALEVGKDVVRETVEESIQGGAGTLAGNIAKQAYADKSQELSEGVGEAIGAGAVIGGIAGGSISAVSQVAKGTGEAKEAVKGAVAKKVIDDLIVKTIGESGDFSAVTDVNVPDYNIEVAVKAIVANSAKEGTTPEQKTENFNTARDIVLENYDRINKLLEETPTPELQKQYTKEEKLQESAARLMFTLQESQAMQSPEVTTAVENVTPESTDRLLGSTRIKPDSVSIEQYKKVLESVKISDAQREEIQDHIKVETAINDMVKVNKDIIEGGKGFLGIRNFQSMVNTSIQKGDIPGAEKAQERLETFATRHTEKAELAAKAYSGDKDAIAQFKEDYAPAFIQPYVSEKKKGSAALVTNLKEEAVALNAAVVQGANTIARAKGTETAPKAEVEVTPPTTTPTEETPTEAVTEPVKETPVPTQEVTPVFEVETAKAFKRSIDTDPDAIAHMTKDSEIKAQAQAAELAKTTDKEIRIFETRSGAFVVTESQDILATPVPEEAKAEPKADEGTVEESKEEKLNTLMEKHPDAPRTLRVKKFLTSNKSLNESQLDKSIADLEALPKPVQEKVVQGIEETEKAKQEPVIQEGPVVQDALTTELQRIMDTSANAVHIRLATRMLPILVARGVKFEFTDNVPYGAYGYYDRINEKILISTKDVVKEFGLDQIILHESIHAVVNGWFHSDRTTEEKMKLSDEFDDLKEVIRVALKDRTEPQYVNILATLMEADEEFLTYGMTNPVVQQILKDIPYKQTTVFSKFVQIISRILGISKIPNTALAGIIDITDRIFNQRETEQSQVVPIKESVAEKVPETGVELDLLAPSMSEAIVGIPVEEKADATLEDKVNNFYNQNLLHQMFDAVPTDDNKFDQNALVAEHDLLQRLGQENGSDIILDYLDQSKTTPEQEANITEMVRFDKKLKQSLRELFKKKDKFRHQDFFQYFVNEQGEINANVQSALTMVAYNWVATSSGSTLFNDDKLINQILGRQEKDKVTGEMYKVLGRAGLTEDMLINSLGPEVFRTLGIRAKKGIPGNIKPQVENALGSMVVALLWDTDYIRHNDMPVLDIQAVIPFKEMEQRKEKSKTDPSITIFTEEDHGVKKVPGKATRPAVFKRFFRAKAQDVVNEAGFESIALANDVESIVEINKGTDGLLDKLFKVKSNESGPTLVPVRTIPKKVKNTEQELTKDAKTVVKKLNQTGYKLKQGMFDTFNALSYETRLRLAGYKVDVDNTVHIDNRLGAHANNDSTEKELRDLNNFGSTFGDGQYAYFEHEIWKQGRMGVVSNTFNMLTSKVHRHFAKLDSWERTINFNNKEEMDQFKLAIAESFGIPTDKQNAKSALKKVNLLIEAPESKLLAAADSIINEEMDDQVILDALTEVSKEVDVYSFDGLVNLALMWEAGQTGQSSFQSDLFREVDGKTNGVAIGILNLYAGASEEKIKATLNRTGMFFDGVTDDFGAWLSNPDNLDVYTLVSKLWSESRVAPKGGQALARFNASIRLFGALGRGDAKGPVTTTVYGSSDGAISNALVFEFMDKITESIEKAVSEGDTARLAAIQEDIGILTGQRVDLTTAPLEQQFDTATYNGLESHIRDAYASTLIDVMAQEFGDFRTKGKAINGAMGVVFNAFTLMLNNEIAKATKAGIADGSLIQNKKGEAVTTLPKETIDRITAELINAQPILASFMSKDVNDGIFVGKYTKVTAEGPGHFTKVEFNRGINKTKNKSISVQGTKRVMIAPGASPTVGVIQGIDAAVMTQHLIQYTAMGVHDAFIAGQGNARDQGKAINKTYMDIHRDYSIMSAAQETLDRAINTLVKYDTDNGSNFVEQLGNTTATEMNKTDTEMRGDTNALNFIQNRLTTFTNNINIGKQKLLDDTTMQAEYFISGGEKMYSKPLPKTQEAANSVVIESVIATATDQSRTPQEINRDTSLKSSKVEIKKEDFTDPATDVNKQNVVEVFDSLGSIDDAVNVIDSPTHTQYLRDLLSNNIFRVLEPFKLYMQNRTDTETVGATDTLDMYIINQIKGAPVISGMLANGIRMTSQEVYLHELIHNVSRAAIDLASSLAARRLGRLWAIVKNDPRTTVEMFMADPALDKTDPTYKDEYAAAKDRYDHIFTPVSNVAEKEIDTATGLETSKQTADYLHEFMAFGMTNARFMEHLKTISLGRPTSDPIFQGSPLEVLSKLFQAAMDTLSNMFLRTPSGNAQEQLDGLFDALTNIDVRKKSQIQEYANTAFTFTEKTLNTGITYTKNQLLKVVEATRLREAKSVFVRVGAKGAAIVLSDERAAAFGLGIEKVRDSIKQGKQGLIASIITEVQGRTENNGTFYDLNRVSNMVIDQQRRAIKTVVAETLLESYSGELTKKQRDALSKILVKTDITALLDFHTLQEIDEFIRPDDATKLIAEISRLESELDRVGGVNNNFYKRAGRNLGLFMAKGKNGEEHPYTNARQIAKLDGTGKTAPHIDIVDQSEVLIDRLATLYSLTYSNKDQRRDVSDLIRSETAVNPQENGITFTLHQIMELKKEAKKSLFGDFNAMMKGYTKDITNPHIDVKYGTLLDEHEMSRRMYIRQNKPIPKDPRDPDKTPIYAYVSKDGGLSTYSAGIIALTSMVAAGTNLTSTRQQAGDPLASMNARIDIKKMKIDKQAAIDEMFLPSTRDPDLSNKNIAMPVFNKKGEVTNYRYIMSEGNKDSLLQKNNEFQDIMGGMAANITDKLESEYINKKTIQALKAQYDEEFSTKYNSYVDIGPNVDDKAMREIYYMLPYSARMEVRQVWNGDVMKVRNDLIPLVFGQRKMNFTDMWDKDSNELRWFHKVLITVFENIPGLGVKAAGRLRRAGNVWQELIKMIKDVIVIKSLVVTVANTVSNMASLWALGVSGTDIMKGHVEGFREATKYQADSKELHKLELVLSSNVKGTAQASANMQRIAVLRNALANNPVRELVEAGVFQTIVEDIDSVTDDFSYKSKTLKAITDKTDKVTSKIPQSVKTVAGNLLVLQSSKTYKVLNHAAQLSDFVARYTLHKHYTTRAVDPLSKKDSIAKVVSIFIDYDLPTHKAIQYGNDMGLLWFTKYNIRVQRILWESTRENPARVLMLLAMQGVFGDIPDQFDGSIFTKDMTNLIKNPLGQYDIMGEIFTINTADNLL